MASGQLCADSMTLIPAFKGKVFLFIQASDYLNTVFECTFSGVTALAEIAQHLCDSSIQAVPIVQAVVQHRLCGCNTVLLPLPLL